MGAGAADLRSGSLHEFTKYSEKAEGSSMRVLITGATGLVGRALKAQLEAGGYSVEQLARPADWNPETGTITASRLEGLDAVVHLAGENIADGRWTPARKNRILNSRIAGTRL